MLVRLAFALLALASGFGIALYALLAALLPKTDSSTPGETPSDHPARPAWDGMQVAAFGSIVFGLLLLLRKFGLWLPDRVMWPLMLASGGLSLVWGRDNRAVTNPPRWVGRLGANVSPGMQTALATLTGSPRRALTRIGAGAFLVMVGAGALAASNGAFRAGRQALAGSAVLLAGLALTLAPWLMRLSSDLTFERRERIRSQERADIASHLHDSVLQTLAIIQRQADDPRRVAALARRQERELRAWLYGDDAARRASMGTAATVAAALQQGADEVEATYGTRVEIVRVGDTPLDDRTGALVSAAREAMTNAAKHAGVPSIDVYLEAQPGALEVFVRDRGRGFTRSEVANDRRGIADSIEGRMNRVGGTVRIVSEPGAGTEVHLALKSPFPSSGATGTGDVR